MARRAAWLVVISVGCAHSPHATAPDAERTPAFTPITSAMAILADDAMRAGAPPENVYDALCATFDEMRAKASSITPPPNTPPPSRPSSR